MWKSFSAPSKAALASLAAAGALYACGPQSQQARAPAARSATVVEPETIGIDTVAQEEPAVARTRWSAASVAARDALGNLHVSIESARGGPVILAFATGVTIRAQPIAVAPAASRSGVGGQSFAAILAGDPRVDAHIYRVESETIAATARNGGLCGKSETKHLAISEFVDASGNWVFKVAAFGAEGAPGSAGRDPGFCRTYPYAASN